MDKIFKVKVKKIFELDMWSLKLNSIYDCYIADKKMPGFGGKYIVCDYLISGNNSSKYTLSYNEREFHDRFVNIQEERKLKLCKINESR